MITLTIFPPAFGLRNVSPFCLKAELALKFLGLEYQIEILDDPRKAPKGKLPFLRIDSTKTNSSEIIADSELIFDYLDELSQGGLYGELSDHAVAQGKAWTRLAEDHLYWIMVASRWVDDEWFPIVREDFFGALPGPLTYIISYFARKQMKQTYLLHGLGKHSLNDQKKFARADLKSISDAVGKDGFILGENLSCFDFTTASLLAGILDQRKETWLNNITDEFPLLRDYAERVQKEVGVYAREIV
ncbi:MAG: glutathione S-transferase family protein [Pseudomonadales bacterium]|nr:glutathione S-transferase family protein [Pseudomonadales bacterium]